MSGPFLTGSLQRQMQAHSHHVSGRFPFKARPSLSAWRLEKTQANDLHFLKSDLTPPHLRRGLRTCIPRRLFSVPIAFSRTRGPACSIREETLRDRFTPAATPQGSVWRTLPAPTFFPSPGKIGGVQGSRALHGHLEDLRLLQLPELLEKEESPGSSPNGAS